MTVLFTDVLMESLIMLLVEELAELCVMLLGELLKALVIEETIAGLLDDEVTISLATSKVSWISFSVCSISFEVKPNNRNTKPRMLNDFKTIQNTNMTGLRSNRLQTIQAETAQKTAKAIYISRFSFLEDLLMVFINSEVPEIIPLNKAYLSDNVCRSLEF